MNRPHPARPRRNIAIKQDRLIESNPAAVLELPPAAKPKKLVWIPQRIRQWRIDHAQHLTKARNRAGGRRVNVLEIYISIPRPSPVMVWTPGDTGRFLTYARNHPLYALFRLTALRGRAVAKPAACSLPPSTWTTPPPPSPGRSPNSAGKPPKAPPKPKPPTAPSPWTRAPSPPCTSTWPTATGYATRPGTPGPIRAGIHHRHRRPAAPGLDHRPVPPAVPPGRPAPIRLHDLHHDAASMMPATGTDIEVVKQTLGQPSFSSNSKPVCRRGVGCQSL